MRTVDERGEEENRDTSISQITRRPPPPPPAACRLRVFFFFLFFLSFVLFWMFFIILSYEQQQQKNCARSTLLRLGFPRHRSYLYYSYFYI